jgi:hypothetical protein
MSAARDLLDDLASIGVRVQLAGDRITVHAGATAIPATILGRIRQAKPELLALLTVMTLRLTARLPSRAWSGHQLGSRPFGTVGGIMPEASNRSRVTDPATGPARDLFEAGLNEGRVLWQRSYGRSIHAPEAEGHPMLTARPPGTAGCRWRR